MTKKAFNESHHAIKRASNISVLDKHRIEQKRERDRSANPFSGWVPDFLIKK